MVATIAAVGYAAHGLAGGLLAAAVAFTPSFSFILLGGGRFARLRANERRARSWTARARRRSARSPAPASRSRARLAEVADRLLAGAACALLLLRRSVVASLLGAGAIGVVMALAGGPLP